MTPPTNRAAITVVIATYKRPDALAIALASLARQTLAPSRFEVAVVIDGSDETRPAYERTLEAARASGAYVLRWDFQANAGQSVARHRGIERATTPWICIIDDDMDLLPGFLDGHLAALTTAKTVVIGRVIPEEDWERAPLYEAVRTSHMLEWHTTLGRGEEEPWGYTLVTQNVSFGREFYLDVGGFDQNLRLAEDSELGLRFEFAGGRFVFASDGAAIHRSRVGSYDAWLRRCVEYGRYGVYIHEKFGRDVRVHPLRNLVNGSRLNATVVRALCPSDTAAHAGIATLRHLGNALQSMGLFRPAVATHKAILAIAYHLGVKSALGSWAEVRESARAFAAAADAPKRPT